MNYIVNSDIGLTINTEYSLCIDVNTLCYRSLVLPRIGMMISVPLYTHRPAKFNLMQAIAGVQMWQSGASNKVGHCSVS